MPKVKACFPKMALLFLRMAFICVLFAVVSCGQARQVFGVYRGALDGGSEIIELSDHPRIEYRHVITIGGKTIIDERGAAEISGANIYLLEFTECVIPENGRLLSKPEHYASYRIYSIQGPVFDILTYDLESNYFLERIEE